MLSDQNHHNYRNIALPPTPLKGIFLSHTAICDYKPLLEIYRDGNYDYASAILNYESSADPALALQCDSTVYIN